MNTIVRIDAPTAIFGRRIIAMNARWDRALAAALSRDDAAYDRHMAAFRRLNNSTRGRGVANNAPRSE